MILKPLCIGATGASLLPTPKYTLWCKFVVPKKLPFAGYSVVKDQDRDFRTRSKLVVHLRQPLATLVASADHPSRSARWPDSRSCERSERPAKAGGEYRDRTGDLLVANQALSQLSYRPSRTLSPQDTHRMPIRSCPQRNSLDPPAGLRRPERPGSLKTR